VYGARDVLDSLVAEILVPDVEFGLNLVECLSGDAYPAGWSEAFKAGRDIDPVTVDVITLDNDIAEMHPDAEVNATLVRYFGVALGHALLYGEGTFDRVDHAGELDQGAITHQLDDATVMVRDPGVDQLRPMALEHAKHTHLIFLHEA
jgi:hypothetical protein